DFRAVISPPAIHSRRLVPWLVWLPCPPLKHREFRVQSQLLRSSNKAPQISQFHLHAFHGSLCRRFLTESQILQKTHQLAQPRLRDVLWKTLTHRRAMMITNGETKNRQRKPEQEWTTLHRMS